MVGEGAVDLLPSADLDIWMRISIIRAGCIVVVASTARILFNSPSHVTDDTCRIETLTLLTVFVSFIRSARKRYAVFYQQFQLVNNENGYRVACLFT